MLYAIVWIPLIVAAWQIAVGTYHFGSPKDSALFILGRLIWLSQKVLVVYTAGFLILGVISAPFPGRAELP